MIFPAIFCCIYLSAKEPVIFQEEKNSFDYFFLEAIRLKLNNEHSEAFNTLKKALQIDSTSSAALYEISPYYLYLQKNDSALAALQKAVKYAPDNFEYLMALADLSREMGHFDASIAYYEALVKKNPVKAELYYYLSSLYIQKEDIDKAIDALNALEDNVGMIEAISMQKYKLYKAIDKNEEAIQEIKKLAARFPTESKYQHMINDSYLDAWGKSLQIAIYQENTDEIISICDSALTYFPDIPEFYLYKGAAYHFKKEYKIALTVYQDGLAIVPGDDKFLLSSFYGQIGDLSFLLKRKEEAYSAYAKALEYNENNVGILNNYAYYLSLDKIDLEKAERMAARCIQFQPDNATYIDTYAWVLFQRGNYSLAKFYIERAVSQSDLLNPEITEHYGDILYQLGNTDMAVSEWEKALLLKEIEGDKDTTLLKKKIVDKTYYEK